jgi:hypothetical protein
MAADELVLLYTANNRIKQNKSLKRLPRILL